ncbi:hypothetical protein B0H14DRAFT_3464277 [Mycena olivaceomarginata]|nr:hypothetical protein B0H14DRAFT_3464277 [Mycena olivaceomarginata]
MPPEKTKKKSSDMHHLTRDDVSPEDKPLQTAFNLHIRALCRLLKASDIPSTPSDETMRAVRERIGSADALAELKAKIRAAQSFNEGVNMAQTLCRTVNIHRTPIAKNIGRIKDSFLRTMFSAVAVAGLQNFCPDVLGSSDSLYNRVHQMVAVQSFQVVAAGWGYAHLKVDLDKVENEGLLEQFWESFVFSYLANLARKEMRKGPGAVAAAIADSNVYRRRQELGLHRKDFLVAELFPAHTIRILEDVECHSDDEGPVANPADPRNPKYNINKKTARNPYITDFFRELDQRRFNAADGLGKAQYLVKERNRVYTEADAKDTKISRRFPPNATVDWFDPEYFNKLPVSIRALYRDAGVALPLPARAQENWQKLSEDDFMAEYGDEVLGLYSFPTDSDMERGDEDEVDDMMQDDT